jgi:hypothetical protein
MEYKDPLGDNATLKAKCHAMHQVIPQKSNWMVEGDRIRTLFIIQLI